MQFSKHPFFKNVGHKSIPGGSDKPNCVVSELSQEKGMQCSKHVFLKKFGQKSIHGGSDRQQVFFVIELRKGNAILEACCLKNFSHKVSLVARIDKHVFLN